VEEGGEGGTGEICTLITTCSLKDAGSALSLISYVWGHSLALPQWTRNTTPPLLPTG
jgi:hypothetical protein